MKIAQFVLGVVLLTGPVAAQPGAPAKAPSRGSSPPISSLWNRQGLESRALFLRLNEMASPAVSHTLHIEFERNGRLIATEDFVLAQGTSGDLEILARRPALLEKIHALSADPESRLTVSIQLDGRTARELSFQDLYAESLQLRGHSRLKPVLLESRVADHLTPAPGQRRAGKTPPFTKGYEPDPDCVQSCYDQYANCSDDNLCNSCFTCQELTSQCISWCPQTCVDPAGVYNWTAQQLVGLDLVDYGCYEDRWEWDFDQGHYYATYYYTIKYTTYRRTLNCDSSYSDEVIGVSYYSDYCSNPEFECSWPATWAPANSC